MIQVQVSCDPLPAIRRIGISSPKNINRIVGAEAVAYRTFLSDRFLSGQVLNERTGRLKRSLKYTEVRNGRSVMPIANIYAIHDRGGTIAAEGPFMANRDVGFFGKTITLPRRRFVQPSVGAFQGSAAYYKAAESVVRRIIEERSGGRKEV